MLAYLELLKDRAADAHFKAMQLWVTAANPRNTKPELPEILKPRDSETNGMKPKAIKAKQPPIRKKAK